VDESLTKTMTFFLRGVALELRRDIDWRAKGYHRNLIQRVGIYLAALIRDIVRIPLHSKEGIGQAHFRVRIQYISDYAIPALEFFRVEYPIDHMQRDHIDEAIELLQRGVGLTSDGRIHALDEWYATMEEFGQLTEYSRQAAKKIEEVVGLETVAV